MAKVWKKSDRKQQTGSGAKICSPIDMRFYLSPGLEGVEN